MAEATLSILGGFALTDTAGGDCAPAGAKPRALLAALALAPDGRLGHDQIAALLWSDRAAPQARDSLKHALAGLRRVLDPLAPGLLDSDRHSVRLDLTRLAVDAVDFRRLAAAEDGAGWAEGLALYRGDLLDGIAARDPAFDDWLRQGRLEFSAIAESLAARLMASAETEGDGEVTRSAAMRLLVLDPLREEAVRALMRLHAAQGERAAALRLFAELRDRLAEEVQAEPDGDTVALEAEIRTGAGRAPGAAAPYPPLPDRPSIAVLPFANLSGDPDQDYFADGIVEEIITALSRIRWLFVIARSSSFTYRGRAVDVKQIAREQGVRYVLEGSLRRAADQVRITARLVDARTGLQLWADSFDGVMSDIFDLQGRITARVVGEIAPRIEEAEIDRATQKPTARLDAYDYYLRGLSSVHLWTRDGNATAIAMFGEAVKRDPDFAAAYGMAVRCHSQRKACGWVTDPAAEKRAVRDLAARAIATGGGDAVALTTAGLGLAFVCGEIGGGGSLIARGLELNPNLAMAWGFSGWINAWAGQPEEAIADLSRAIRLSPHDPHAATTHGAMACAHFFAERDDEAVHWAESSIRLRPSYQVAHCILAAALARSGRAEDARQVVERLRLSDPGLRIATLLEAYPFQRPRDAARLSDGLATAGLQE
ncbi:BTAD domain-containing putative transcriptional regulator [Defluviimonas sp. D31]|uniref:BTAD domain-containing putative transcriptional regulator n=1 Tax=Defluviimonas sp. D31 TaxID=3083253 RepID=UPI00296FE57A|nr:BTAD domain-containing putative transcriptional regulator [Defluviimonas sp. D31]MDW4549940.1 BTAD domain-containing putative transcriptional regulator [Defluviimonas sp. D31]